MLSDDKKAMIEAEEKYRHEVSKNLQKDLEATGKDIKNLGKDFWAKAGEVLNSNFGLWFLSSVFFAFPFFCLDKLTQKRKLKFKRNRGLV